MTRGGQIRAICAGLMLGLMAVPGLAQDAAAGGGVPVVVPPATTVVPPPSPTGQPTIKVHADSSGTLIPEKTRAPIPVEGSDAVISGGGAPSGGVAPQGGGRPAGAGAVKSGGGSSGALDYPGWDKMAVRAETAIQGRNASNSELDLLRAQLVTWREALLGAQSANSPRIATLGEQIDALGPAPTGGVTETPEIAKLRAKLSDQLVLLQAPGIAAGEAYRRADGLVGEIDRVVRERQADELLKLWPTPLYPGNWSEALEALSRTATTIWLETNAKLHDPQARQHLYDNLPVILPLLIFAIAVLWRGRRWMDRLIDMLQGPATARGRRIWGFLASLALIIVPTLGFIALAQALTSAGLLGLVGSGIAVSLGGIGLTLFAAVWLGTRVFPVGETVGSLLILTPDYRAEGRFLTSSFGLLLAIARLRRVVMAQLEVSDAANAVLNFPIIIVGAVLLLRMGQLMRVAARAEPMLEDGRAGYRRRVISVLARVAVAIGIAGPLLGAIGYISAASALIFPAAMSLGLAALVYLMQRLVGDLYSLISRSETPEKEALVPVLISFALALATLPMFALIWGARVSDITELWTRFQEGFTLGNARISPTDFLFFAIVFFIGLSLTRLLQGALKTSILPRTGMDQGGQNAVVSGLGYAGIMISALVAINSTGIDLSGLAIVAGALSVGIGFGLQTVVSNFVSGIILLIERPISEGDWIEVGPVQGIVSSISVRSTRIQTFDRSDVIVPNSDLISGRVTNWTRFSLSGRLIVPVAVPFTTDSRRVEAILREVVEAQPLTLLSPPPIVALMAFGPETMNFEIRVILRDVNFLVEVKSEINHQIAKRFAEEGILLSNAHRDYVKRVADEAAALAEEQAESRAHQDAVAALLGPITPKPPRLAPPDLSPPDEESFPR